VKEVAQGAKELLDNNPHNNKQGTAHLVSGVSKIAGEISMPKLGARTLAKYAGQFASNLNKALKEKEQEEDRKVAEKKREKFLRPDSQKSGHELAASEKHPHSPHDHAIFHHHEDNLKQLADNHVADSFSHKPAKGSETLAVQDLIGGNKVGGINLAEGGNALANMALSSARLTTFGAGFDTERLVRQAKQDQEKRQLVKNRKSSELEPRDRPASPFTTESEENREKVRTWLV
jgi:hypothetical protein